MKKKKNCLRACGGPEPKGGDSGGGRAEEGESGRNGERRLREIQPRSTPQKEEAGKNSQGGDEREGAKIETERQGRRNGHEEGSNNVERGRSEPSGGTNGGGGRAKKWADGRIGRE